MEKESFVLNTYEKCTANKITNGKYCTIQWYVDNNKVICVNEYVITVVVSTINKHFG